MLKSDADKRTPAAIAGDVGIGPPLVWKATLDAKRLVESAMSAAFNYGEVPFQADSVTINTRYREYVQAKQALGDYLARIETAAGEALARGGPSQIRASAAAANVARPAPARKRKGARGAGNVHARPNRANGKAATAQRGTLSRAGATRRGAKNRKGKR